MTKSQITKPRARRRAKQSAPPEEARNPFTPEPYENPPALSTEEQEQVVVAEVLDGATPAQAARAAGLSAPGAGLEVLRRPHVRGALVSELAAHGIDDARLARVINEGLDAVHPPRVYKDGSATLEHPDHMTRHRYLGTVLELRGDLARTHESEDTWEAMVLAVRTRRSAPGAQ